MVTLLMLLISFPSLMAAMLVSAMLSKLLLGWIVLIELSTTFTFLAMHALLELLLAMVLCRIQNIKIVVYRIFTKINIFHKTFIFKLFYYVIH